MSLRPGNTAPFQEMSQRWRVADSTVSDLTGPRFEPQTSRSCEERVNAQPTGRFCVEVLVSNSKPGKLNTVLPTTSYRCDLSWLADSSLAPTDCSKSSKDYWDFRDALSRKSLSFFRQNLRIRQQKYKTL